MIGEANLIKSFENNKNSRDLTYLASAIVKQNILYGRQIKSTPNDLWLNFTFYLMFERHLNEI